MLETSSTAENRTFFTVIIPLHNKQRYIKKCLTSVLQQSFSEFELLIVDDASSDESLKVAQSISDRRVRILSRSSPGFGGYAARNFGASHARSEWLTFLDADDYWLPHHLENIKAAILTNPKVPLFFTGFEKRGKKKEKICEEITEKINATEAMKRLSKKDIFHINAMAIKKSLYLQSGGFSEDRGWRRGGDSELWPRLIASAKRIVLVSGATSVWDINNSDITSKSFEGSLDHPALVSFNEGSIREQSNAFRRSHYAFAVRKQLMWDAKAPVGEKPLWKSVLLFVRGPITSRTTKEFIRLLKRSIYERLRN